MRKRVNRSTAIVLVPLFALAALLVLGARQCANFFRPSDDDYRHYAIVESSQGRVARRKFIGKTVADVTAVYGESSPSDKFADWDRKWVLCPNGLDFYWLLVDLDENGLVVRAEVVSD